MKIVVCVESPKVGHAGRAALSMAAGLGGDVTYLSASAADVSDAALVPREARITRSVLLSDRRLETADYLGLGAGLAQAARRLEANLILTGTQSDDEGQGAIAAAIACALNWTFVARIESLAIDPDRPGAVLAEIRAGGFKRKLRIPLPAVLSVVPSPTRTARRRTRSNQAPPEILRWSLRDVGIAPQKMRQGDDLGLFVPLTTKVAAAASAEELLRACLSSPKR